MFGIVLAVLLSIGCVYADGPVARKLTILHTNDLHARLLPDAKGRGGFAQLAAAIRAECAQAQECLVLDAGDLVQGSPVSTLFRGEPIFEIANTLGLDLTTLGNHEFDYGWRRIESFREAAEFLILNANMSGPQQAPLADAASTVIVTGNGIRIGVIGVVTASLPYLVTPELLGEWRALPVRESVEAALKPLRSRCDLVVVLGHITAREEQQLLAVPGVDLIISGHTHNGLDKPLSDADTALFRVKSYGRQLGRIDLVLSDGPLSWTWRAIPIVGIEPDPATLEAVMKWEAKVAKLVDRPLAYADRHYDRAELRTLFERALREETGADLAYINPGAIRDRLSRGALLERDLWNAMPFDDRIVVGTVLGARLPASLRRERALDPEKQYRLATIDFVAAQWHRRGQAELELEHGERLRDLLIRWFRKQERVP